MYNLAYRVLLIARFSMIYSMEDNSKKKKDIIEALVQTNQICDSHFFLFFSNLN
jgi:hypothetical protein